MNNFVRRHCWAFVIAMLIGVGTFLPQVIAVHNLGEEWKGVYSVQNDDEIYYLARSQEVYDGYPTIAQPYLREGKDSYPLQFWMPDAGVAYIGMAFGLDAREVFVFMDFIAPACIFLLLYSIGILLFGGVAYALSFSILLSVGIFFSTFNRPISPQVTLIPLLVFVYAMLRVMRNDVRIWTIL